MKEIDERNTFVRKNYTPFDLRLIIAVLGLCLFIDPVDTFTYDLSASYLELIFGRNFFHRPKVIKVSSTSFAPPAVMLSETFPSEKPAVDDVCHEEECYRIADRLENFMDPSVDPCDNFYNYACGSYMNKADLPDNAEIADVFQESDYNMRQELLKSMTNDNNSNDSRTFQLMKKFFKACMNTSDIDTKNLKPLQEVLHGLGGWPILEGDSWNETAFDWVNVSIAINKAGYQNSLVTINVNQDYKNKTKNIIYMSPPHCKKRSTAYFEYMTTIVGIFGTRNSRIVEDINATIEFENDLKLSEHFGSITPPNRTTINKLSKTFSWADYLRRLFPASVSLNDDEVVYQQEPLYFQSLEDLIAHTPKRVIANYLLWKVVQESIRFLDKSIPRFDYGHASNYSSRSWYRPAECVTVVNQYMPLGSIAMYVKNSFEAQNREDILEIINRIKQQVIFAFEQAKWMDDDSKRHATEKVQEMEHYVGYFDVFFDDAKLDKFHETLEVSEFDYFNSRRNITKFNIDVNMNLLREASERTDWRLLHRNFLFGPFYNPASNAMVILAPSLTESIFHERLPKYINYGRIGYVISHEMVHSFHKSDLVSHRSQNYFRETYICIVLQYLKYGTAGKKVNAMYTFEENMADNSGIKLAYNAYNKWLENNGPEKKLPSNLVDKTAKQLFWLNYANFWCAKSTEEYSIFSMESDPHSPHELRVIGPLSNSPEFANDWNCPSGSKMNPTDKKCPIL